MDVLRYCCPAKDYVRMQRIILQLGKPEDFFIATGKQNSLHEFLRISGAEVGDTLTFSGEDIKEINTRYNCGW
jgi:GDPmannose 4,6-dehydratase